MATDEENRLITERRAKLQRLREAGNAYPNDFRRDALADELLAAYESHSAESLAAHAAHGERRGPPDGQARHGRHELREAPGPLGADSAHAQARSARRDALWRVQEVGRGRHRCGARRAHQDEDRRAVDRRRRAAAAREVAAAAAGEVARHHGCRDEAAAALCRPDHERGDARGVPPPQRVDPLHPQFSRCARLHRGRDADDAADPGRRGGAAVRDASQCARRDAVFAYRAGALFEAPAWSAASSACTSSIACSATRDCRRGTTPSSRCSSSIRPTPVRAI